MAGIHEVGGNLFEIPPLDDFGLEPPSSLSDGNAPPLLNDVLGDLPEIPFQSDNNSGWPNDSIVNNFGNFSSNVGDFGDFGNFTTSEPTKGNDDFGNFADASKGDDDFGNFTTTNASKDDDFGNFTTANASKDDDFGNFTTSEPTKDDDFGNFTTSEPTKDDDFGNFTTSEPTKDDDFGNFTTTNASKDDDFGNFTTANASKDDDFRKFNTSIPSQDEPLSKDDDEFGKFDSFSKQSKKSDWSNSLMIDQSVLNEMSSITDIIVACFPTDKRPLDVPVKQLKDLFEDKYFSGLSKEIGLTSSLYQWNQSLLQDRFFNSLKVDPMLVPADGTGNDPFTVTSLLDDLGIVASVETQLNDFSRSNETGGVTLLDLSLPMSPTNKESQGSGSVPFHNELRELDFNVSMTSSSNMTIGDMSTSWMDSELMELEKDLPTNTVAAGPTTVVSSSNFDWLNNPELTTMVKPSGDTDLGLGLEPTSSSGAVLLSDNSNLPYDEPSTHSNTPLDPIFLSSPSPDPSLTGLVPPDPILLGPTPSHILSDLVPGKMFPDSVLSANETVLDPTHKQMFPDPAVISADPLSNQMLPDLALVEPTPNNVDEQTTLASQSLNIVMEMTNNVSNSPILKCKRPSLSPPRSSIDILEDQLLELTIKQKQFSPSIEEDTPQLAEGFSPLSEQARLLLNKLPNLSFMRRKQLM